MTLTLPRDALTVQDMLHHLAQHKPSAVVFIADPNNHTKVVPLTRSGPIRAQDSQTGGYELVHSSQVPYNGVLFGTDPD